MANNKEFSWDDEIFVGEIVESEKVKHFIKICTLNGVEYVVSSKMLLKKDGWATVKNQTFKRPVFDKLISLVKGE